MQVVRRRLTRAQSRPPPRTRRKPPSSAARWRRRSPVPCTRCADRSQHARPACVPPTQGAHRCLVSSLQRFEVCERHVRVIGGRPVADSQRQSWPSLPAAGSAFVPSPRQAHRKRSGLMHPRPQRTRLPPARKTHRLRRSGRWRKACAIASHRAADSRRRSGCAMRRRRDRRSLRRDGRTARQRHRPRVRTLRSRACDYRRRSSDTPDRRDRHLACVPNVPRPRDEWLDSQRQGARGRGSRA